MYRANPDTPQKEALRNEVEARDEEIKILKVQLRGVQQSAISELTKQQHGFEAAVQQYEMEARDIAKAEVGRANARLGGQLQSVRHQLAQMQIAEKRIQSEAETAILQVQSQVLQQVQLNTDKDDIIRRERT